VKTITLIILSFLSLSAVSQDHLTGKIIDKNTRQSLAFVNIVFNDNGYGTVSNIDGEFTLPLTENVSYLKFSYVGYHTQWLDLPTALKANKLIIKLDKKTYDIEEVKVLPGINPAHRIIKLATKNRKLNNPEKMRSFSYRSYNKMFFTLLFDTVVETVPSNNLQLSVEINNSPDTSQVEQDSSLNEALDFFEKQHLFLMEFISEREFRQPDQNQEIVTASRVSGFKDPSFTLLATQIQSFAFYDDLIMIWDKKYLNPISPGSTRKYLFVLEDTLYTPRDDTIFVISYNPLKNRNFDGLKGILHINSNQYAVQHVIAEAAELNTIFRIRIQQKYVWMEDTQWFPEQLNTDIIIRTNEMETEGVPVTFVGIGKSYLSDISLNPDIRRRVLNQVEMRVEEDAHLKPDEYWDQYRMVPLTSLDTNTYIFIDSIGEEANLDRSLKIIETVASGYIPWKFLDIDYTSLIHYNRYEGFRFGIGLQTNNRMSRYVQLGGKFAYGIKDNEMKYGGFLKIIPDPVTETYVQAKYSYDVTETGGIQFITRPSITSSEAFRSFLIADKDLTEEKEISLGSALLPYTRFQVFLNQSTKKVSSDYRYSINNEPQDLFHFTELGVKIRYAYKEKFIETPRGNRISTGTNYPVIHANITSGLSYLDGEFEYLKLEGKISKTFITRSLGDTKITLLGGMVDKPIPYTNLFNGHGSYGVFTIESENSFATMRMNEFIMDRFAAVFFQHDFGKLIFNREKFHPGIVIATHAGYGELFHTDNHGGIDIQTIDKGYIESGLLIKNLLNQWFIGYGIGVFYRYGPYSLTKTIDNFAFKFTISFNI